MNFKDLKQNYTVYVLDKTELSCREEKVISVSVPRFDNKAGAMPSMLVDVTLEESGKPMTYVFPDSTTKAYNGNKIFFTKKEDVIAEIRAIKRASEQVIADMDKHKDAIAKCTSLLSELDTEEKAKIEMEHRLTSMENRQDEIYQMLRQLTAGRTTALVPVNQ